MTEKVAIINEKTGRPVEHKFMAWRCSDGKTFVTKTRAVFHQLEIFAEQILDEGEFDDSKGTFTVTKEGKKPEPEKRGGK